MQIYNVLDKMEFLEEVITLEHDEWGKNKEFDRANRIKEKIEKTRARLKRDNFCKLVLVEDNILIGFVSIFPNDCDECKELTPWYATMYVKKEYRGKGYSKILNDAILNEAKNRNHKEIFLKSDLVNYYEKFGAIFLKELKNGERLYKIDLRG